MTTSTSATLDTQTLRQAYGQFPTGVVAIAAQVDGEPLGLAASTFVPVSSILRWSPSVSRTRQRPGLGSPMRPASASACGADHSGAARSLGSKDSDRFVGLTTKTTCEGALFIDGATAWLDTCIQDTVPAGDHAIVILRVHGLSRFQAGGADRELDGPTQRRSSR